MYAMYIILVYISMYICHISLESLTSTWMITISIFRGRQIPGETDVEHRWQTQSFDIHKGEVHAVSWASSVRAQEWGH
jgi:hypothetical protein